MSRRSSGKRRLDEEDVKPSPRRLRVEASQEEDEEEDEERDTTGFGFSQQIPEASQSVLPERDYERRNLESMDRTSRETALTSLSRLVLFKALDGEPIDRLKTIKDAGLAGDKISNAAYREVAARLRNVFGFSLQRTPAFLLRQKSIPRKFHERYYVINTVQDTDDGSHSKLLHAASRVGTIEKGVLILTVALVFCKGESRSDGSRHILARDLYKLMNKVDENIPESPPGPGTARAKQGLASFQRLQGGIHSGTPNFDAMLESFVHSDYLVREKATPENYLTSAVQEDDVLYSMGPRAALELGRRQIITFCAEILGEEPDPSMLKEIEHDDEEENGLTQATQPDATPTPHTALSQA